MKIKELQEKVHFFISDIKDNWKYPKENNLVDYKRELKINTKKDWLENFLINLVKDILSFGNGNWWIIFLWIEEDKATGEKKDIWLLKENLDLLKWIDLNDLSQKIKKISWQYWDFDLQEFNISTRKFYYFLISKSDDTLIPNSDLLDYWNIKKWEIYYRIWWKNQLANESTSELNKFIQVKANEKSKDFMEIWSNLLPEMVDINPKEVLILNPIQNKVYWFNGKDNTLSWSEIEIVQDENNVFNIILETIKAWEVWKITDTEWKPMYKIVWEMKTQKEYTSLTSVHTKIQELSGFNISQPQLKHLMFKLWWVAKKNFGISINDTTIRPDFIKNEDFLWPETTDAVKHTWKIVFSEEVISIISDRIKDIEYQKEIFWKELTKNNNAKTETK